MDPTPFPASTAPDPDATLGAMDLVLLIEDERDFARMLDLYLRQAGYRTEVAHDGKRGLELFHAARPDLVLLDLGLPELDGLEVLSAIRRDSEVPVVVLTARSEEVDELLGLGLGADDYVVKPCSPRTLLARLRAVLRRSRSGTPSPTVRRIGPLEVDSYRVQARVEGTELTLTPTEFRLLETLASAPGKAMTRAELLEAALPESDALERVVDVHLGNLRRKLADHGADPLLETVRGVGYRLREG